MSAIPQPIVQPVQPNRPFASRRLDRVLTWFFSHVVLILFTVVIVYPVVWMAFASFKNQDEVVSNIWGLPTTLHWENYTAAWTQGQLGIALLNSTIVALFTLV